jgi:HlyD family secretion protein
VSIRTGITDGTYTEVLQGDLKDGQEVIVAATGGSAPRSSAPATGGTAPRARF